MTAYFRKIEYYIKRSETVSRFLYLVKWTLIAFALEKFAMIIVIFLLARVLGAQDYGRFILAQGLVNASQIFVVVGAGTMLARYIPKMREEGIQRAVEIINLCALLILGTTTAVSIAGIVGADYVATRILDVPIASLLPYWMLAWLFLIAVNNLLLTIMLSFEKGRVLGLIALIGSVMTIVFTPILALRYGLQGVISGFVCVEAFKAVVLAAIYVRFVKQSGARVLTPARRSDVPLLLSFGLPIFLQSALWAPTIWLAQLIVKTASPDGLVAVGVFGFANNIFGVVVLFSGLTNRAALPILSSLQARGTRDELRKKTWLLSFGQIGVATILGLPLALAAPYLTSFAGAEFAATWPVLVIMIVTGIVVAGQTSLGNYLLVMDRSWYLFVTIIPWTLILLAAATFLPQHGAYALAGGLFAASVVRTILFALGCCGLRTPSLRRRGNNVVS